MEIGKVAESTPTEQTPPDNQQSIPQTQPVPLQKKPFWNKKRIIILIVVLIIITVVVLGVAYFLIGRNQNLRNSAVSQDNPDSYNDRPPLASITDPEKEAIFNKLTSHNWCDKQAENSRSLLAPTRKNYTFKKDGTYNYSHFSDYPEDGGSGKWNFNGATENSGIMLLDSGDVLHFEINNNSLLLANLSLEKCDKIEYGQVDYSVNNLPLIQPSILFNTLTSAENKWIKSNELDLFRLPTKIVFSNNGYYTAEFNNGECSYNGTWSLRKSLLIRKVPKKNCDFRVEGKESYHSYSIKYEGDILEFEGSGYISESKASPDEGIIWSDFGSYGGARVKIRYTRPIESDISNKLTIEIKNDDKNSITLKDLSISQQQYAKTNDGFSVAGDEKFLSSKDLSAVTLDSGQSYNLTEDVTFSGEGYFGVILKLNYDGKTQPYNARENYVLAL